MILKNAVFYKIVGDIPVKIDEYKELAERIKVDIGKPTRELGCDYVISPKIGEYAYYSSGCVMMNFVFKQKKVPSKILKKLTETQVHKKEKELNRYLSRKEIAEIKSTFESQLKSKVIESIKEVFVYIDFQESILVADCSYNSAEKIISLLRSELGTFKVEKGLSSESVSRKIRSWFCGEQMPNNLQLGYKVKLKSEDEDGASASFTNDIILQDEIQVHKDKKVKALEIVFDSLLTCTVKDDGSIGSVKFINSFGKDESQDEDYNSIVDAEFLVLKSCLNAIYKSLL